MRISITEPGTMNETQGNDLDEIRKVERGSHRVAETISTVMPSETKPRRQPDLISKNGVFYARLGHSTTGEPLDVALHGISSEEQARAAAQVLMLFGRSPGSVDK